MKTILPYHNELPINQFGIQSLLNGQIEKPALVVYKICNTCTAFYDSSNAEINKPVNLGFTIDDTRNTLYEQNSIYFIRGSLGRHS